MKRDMSNEITRLRSGAYAAGVADAARAIALMPNPHRADYARGFHDALVEASEAVRALAPGGSEPIQVKHTFDAIRVYFGNVLHLHLPARNIAIESWMDYGGAKFVIEYTLHTGATVVTEYDAKSKWLAVLDGLDRALAPQKNDDVRAAAGDSQKLWLWRNGPQEYWAFRHLYPCVSPGGDPCTLGEPIGYVLLKPSFPGPREKENG